MLRSDKNTVPSEKRLSGSVDLAVCQGIDIEFACPSLGYELVEESQALLDDTAFPRDETSRDVSSEFPIFAIKQLLKVTLGQSIETQLFGHEVRIAQA
jgi:hypothetical protein